MGAEAAAEQTPVESTPENVEALLEAARYDDIEDVISLASSGVSLDSKDSQGRTGGNIQFVQPVELLEKFFSPDKALHMASANGHVDIVDYLITNGVDVNAANVEKNTPLHWACLNGHIEVVKNLILAGASVAVINSHEQTPMDEAVSRGKMDVIDAISAAVAQVELSGTRVS